MEKSSAWPWPVSDDGPVTPAPDEPLIGLDARLRAAILQDLRELVPGRHTPILYVTDNREELDAIGEQVIALADGKVTGVGSAREVRDAPESVAIAQASGFENLLEPGTEVTSADGIMRVGWFLQTRARNPAVQGHKETGVQIAIRAGDILIATEPPGSLSARNVLTGTIESLQFARICRSVQI